MWRTTISFPEPSLPLDKGNEGSGNETVTTKFTNFNKQTKKILALFELID